MSWFAHRSPTTIMNWWNFVLKEEKVYSGTAETFGKQWQVGDVVGVFLDLIDRTISKTANLSSERFSCHFKLLHTHNSIQELDYWIHRYCCFQIHTEVQSRTNSQHFSSLCHTPIFTPMSRVQFVWVCLINQTLHRHTAKRIYYDICFPNTCRIHTRYRRLLFHPVASSRQRFYVHIYSIHLLTELLRVSSVSCVFLYSSRIQYSTQL